MEIEEKVLKLIKSKKEGILQNQLWKTAKIDSSKCSRIVAKFEKDGIISREPDSEGGSRTFRIKYIEKKEVVKDYKLLMIGELFSPCTGCELECIPEQCPQLLEWIYCLEKEE